MSRLSKDQDTLDTEVAMIAFQVCNLSDSLSYSLTSPRSFSIVLGDYLLFLTNRSSTYSLYSSVVGTAGLVFYTFPYLGIMFAPLSVLYLAGAVYYRRSSVETKRLDSLMRSALYASYSGMWNLSLNTFITEIRVEETLTGLSTVRGYGEQVRFYLTYPLLC